jgi:hypothetical protein
LEAQSPEFKPSSHQKKKKRINVGEDVEKLKPSYNADGNIKWCRHFGNQFGKFSKS